ncbi:MULTISPECIES: hypothetical protein [unclassified Pseudomonas]|uniref:hypothetical protein n=1 Tax=unclassified Pseudomonas TaxID=196821 RepID=UPI002456C604|nr:MULTISPECIES: hypothetical protein [unclassified Pseudomonas]
MSRHKITLVMPAPAAATFEAFHNHSVRLEWDTLLSITNVEGGGSHPYIGAVTFNQGRGWMRPLSMRTRFVNYQPGKVAAAVLVEPAGVFQEWSASMRHRDLDEGKSELIYRPLAPPPFRLRILMSPLCAGMPPPLYWLFDVKMRSLLRISRRQYEINFQGEATRLLRNFSLLSV